MRYDYQCSACESVWEETLKMVDNEKPISEPCPHCEATGTISRFYGPDSIPRLADPHNVMGRHRMPTDFKNMLSNMKKFYKQDHINDSGTIT